MNEALTRSLETGAPRDWAVFIGAAQPVVASGVIGALARWSQPNLEQIDDLIDETFLKLCTDHCGSLKRFRAECPGGLPAYLRAMGFSVASDFLRSRDTAIDAVEHTDRAELLGRIDRCLRSQDDRDRWIFWFYYRHGVALDSISEILRVTVREAGAAIDRLTDAASAEWTDRTQALRACDPGAVEPSCLAVDEIASIAAQAALSGAPELFDHIADCDRCGGLLRDVLASRDEPVTAGLRTSSAEWRAAMAKRWSREARSGSPRYWLPAAAASLARRWQNSRPQATRGRVVRTAAAPPAEGSKD